MICETTFKHTRNRYNKMRFRSLLSLVLALLFPVILAAQTETGPPSKNSSANPVKQRLEQILAHVGQTSTAPEAQSASVQFDPRSRDKAPQTSLRQAVRLAGSPIAAERYVFGRMDLATGDNPNGVAVGRISDRRAAEHRSGQLLTRHGVHHARQC